MQAGAQRFIAGVIPERFVEVDAARLLLILDAFARPVEPTTEGLLCYPTRPITSHFTPEYYLHKLDFLLRYPDYFAYELIELHRLGVGAAINRNSVCELVRSVLHHREPELMTLPFRRFWRGAYERIDAVESWFHARELIYVGIEPRGEGRPQKHYFLTEKAHVAVQRLIAEVPESRWYADRIGLIYRYFSTLTPAQVKALQYRHAEYRNAQLAEEIPSLSPAEIREAFESVFNEPIGVDLDRATNAVRAPI